MDALLSDKAIASFVTSYPRDYWSRVLVCLARYAINSLRVRHIAFPALSELERLSENPPEERSAVNEDTKLQLTDLQTMLHRLDKKLLRTLKDAGMWKPRSRDEQKATNRVPRQRSRAASDVGVRLTVPANFPRLENNYVPQCNNFDERPYSTASQLRSVSALTKQTPPVRQETAKGPTEASRAGARRHENPKSGEAAPKGVVDFAVAFLNSSLVNKFATESQGKKPVAAAPREQHNRSVSSMYGRSGSSGKENCGSVSHPTKPKEASAAVCSKLNCDYESRWGKDVVPTETTFGGGQGGEFSKFSQIVGTYNDVAGCGKAK